MRNKRSIIDPSKIKGGDLHLYLNAKFITAINASPRSQHKDGHGPQLHGRGQNDQNTPLSGAQKPKQKY